MEKVVKAVMYIGIGAVAGGVFMALVTLLPIGLDQEKCSIIGAIVGGLGGLVGGALRNFA